MKRSAAPLALVLLGACAYAPTREPRSVVELRRQDTVLQTHEYSCGAAALATLMGRFGRPETESGVLRAAFGKSLPMERGPDGRPRLRALTLADLEKAARAAGFKVVSVQVPSRRAFAPTLEALGPGIARMQLYGEYPHFVLLEEIRDGWVRVRDPGYGNFWLPAGQLFASWDAGERFFLTISARPFYAWKQGDDRPAYLKRSDEEPLPASGEPAPPAIIGSVSRRAALLSSLAR